MLSLKDDQNNSMNDINSLLNNASKEIGVIGKIKEGARELSLIHSDMEEIQSFILQLSKIENDSIPRHYDKDEKSNSKETKEK